MPFPQLWIVTPRKSHSWVREVFFILLQPLSLIDLVGLSFSSNVFSAFLLPSSGNGSQALPSLDGGCWVQTCSLLPASYGRSLCTLVWIPGTSDFPPLPWYRWDLSSVSEGRKSMFSVAIPTAANLCLESGVWAAFLSTPCL